MRFQNQQIGINLTAVEISPANPPIFCFDRNIRNAIVHKTCKVDILKETVEFIDRNKTIILTFRDVQKGTQELSALLLILLHVFVSIFCLAVLSMREMLDSIPKREH